MTPEKKTTIRGPVGAGASTLPTEEAQIWYDLAGFADLTFYIDPRGTPAPPRVQTSSPRRARR